MRIVADLRSLFTGLPQIVQVDKVPPVGAAGATGVNGKFVIPVPLDEDFGIDENAYILDGAGDIDGGDVVSEAMAHLLARYPQFGNVYFNPLITDDHVGELDLSATFADPAALPGVTFPTRAQTGRGPGGPEVAGQMPNNTAILGQNNTVTPARPGVLVTDLIDIGPYTLDEFGNPAGADEFLMWWKVYDFDVSQDVSADYGALAGTNSPAIRSLSETDQEPTDFEVYLSTDNGGSWHAMGLFETVSFCNKATTIRMAFVNRAPHKMYLTSFAVCF